MSQQGHVQALRAENHRTLQQPSVALPAGAFLEPECHYYVMGRSGPIGRNLTKDAADQLAAASGCTVYKGDPAS